MELREELGLSGILAGLNCGGQIPHEQVMHSLRPALQRGHAALQVAQPARSKRSPASTATTEPGSSNSETWNREGVSSMADIPRLNGAIKALESGKPAFVPFTSGEISNALTIAGAPYDGVVFEMEHNPYDIKALRDCLQYMLNRRQIAHVGIDRAGR